MTFFLLHGRLGVKPSDKLVHKAGSLRFFISMFVKKITKLDSIVEDIRFSESRVHSGNTAKAMNLEGIS